jgi:hypothetical protein
MEQTGHIEGSKIWSERGQTQHEPLVLWYCEDSQRTARLYTKKNFIWRLLMQYEHRHNAIKDFHAPAPYIPRVLYEYPLHSRKHRQLQRMPRSPQRSWEGAIPVDAASSSYPHLRLFRFRNITPKVTSFTPHHRIWGREPRSERCLINAPRASACTNVGDKTMIETRRNRS